MGSSASPAFVRYVYPSCVPLDVHAEMDEWQPDPIWTGVAFAVAFGVAAAISGAAAPFAVKLYRRKQILEREHASMKENGIPMHKHGVRTTNPENKKQTHEESKTQVHTKVSITCTESPAAKPLPATPPEGVIEILFENTSGAAAFIMASRDLADVLAVERDIAYDKIKTFVYLLRLMLQKLVAGKKLDASSTQSFARKVETQLEEDVEARDEEQAKQDAAADVHPGQEQGTAHSFTEFVNNLVSTNENRVEEWLRQVSTSPSRAELAALTESDIDQQIYWLKTQLHSFELKLSKHTSRQLEILDAKLARRREMLELGQLKKHLHAEEHDQRMQDKSHVLDSLVRDQRLDEKQAIEIMNEYDSRIAALRQQLETENSRQERELIHKLQQRRSDQLMRLAEQQQRDKMALLKPIQVSLDEDKAEQGHDAVKTIGEYLDLAQQQREEKETLVSQLDKLEESEIYKMQVTNAQQMSTSADNSFNNTVRASSNISEDDVKHLILLNKQRIEEIQRECAKNRKKQQDKLVERLAQQKKAREQEKQNASAEQALLAQQQRVMVTKVLETQVELTEEACKQIMMEHERNISALTTQIALNQRRQQAGLEKKLAERRAGLAQRVNEAETARAASTEAERGRIAANIKAQEEQMHADHARAIDDLRNRLAEETRQALLQQEDRLSLAIGKLQVGQARRRGILQRQNKLLAELQDQMADKLAKKKTSNTTADQLLQQHQNEVMKLTTQLETDKERQEKMLQDKLERKKLLREQDLQQQMKTEAENELEEQRARGTGKAAKVLFGMLLEQKHKKEMEDLEFEIQADLRKQRDEISAQFENELTKALDEQSKSLMATVAAISDLNVRDINEAVKNAAQTVHAKDPVVRKLAKEMKAEVARAKSAHGLLAEHDSGAGATPAERDQGLRRTKTDLGGEVGPRSPRPKTSKTKPPRAAYAEDA